MERKAGFTPAVTNGPSKRLPASRHSVGVPRGRPASPVPSKAERKAGFTPAVTYAPSKRLPASRHSVGVPRGSPASPVLFYEQEEDSCGPEARAAGREGRSEE